VPGNIRELENKIESAFILSGEKDLITSEHFQLGIVPNSLSQKSESNVNSDFYQGFLNTN